MLDASTIPTPIKQPRKVPLYRKMWFWVSVTFVVLAGVCLWNYNDIYHFVKSIECKRQGTMYEFAAYGPGYACLQVAPDAGKDCVQPADCSSKTCSPNFEFTDQGLRTTLLTEPKVNDEGYVVGACGRYTGQGTTLRGKVKREQLNEPRLWSLDYIETIFIW